MLVTAVAVRESRASRQGDPGLRTIQMLTEKWSRELSIERRLELVKARLAATCREQVNCANE